MIKAEIKSIKLFCEFLSVAIKFVQQGQLVINTNQAALYCKNPQDFSTSRLLLETNSMNLLPNSEEITEIKYCIKDLTALRAALTIVNQVENTNNCIVELENIPSIDGNTYAKTFRYSGISNFKLISIDPTVIEKYISNELKKELGIDIEFDINPVNLDILQNRTGSIVNTTDDVSIYIYPDTKTNKIMVDLNTRQTDYMNSISLPISDSYSAKEGYNMPEVAVHESAFRAFNILKVKENLHCAFTSSYNVFTISSSIEDENHYYIKSRIMHQIIKGK